MGHSAKVQLKVTAVCRQFRPRQLAIENLQLICTENVFCVNTIDVTNLPLLCKLGLQQPM